LHAANLELELLEAVVHQRDLQTFWQQMPSAAQRPSQKRLPTPTRLVRTWARIRQIEYLGEQMTYDLSVAGPYHNFVANGFIVHNSVNEYSTRYSVAIDAAQSTVADAWRLQATNNRQGSGGFLDVTTGQNLSEREAAFQHLAREVYEERLAHGIAREQARKDLPLSTYTEAYWKIDLHNLLHFLGLRMDEHAQAEIRAYAEVIGTTIVQRWCPLAWEAFVDYQRQSLTLSRLERDIIRALVQGDNAEALMLARAAGLVPPAGAALTRNRERDELAAKLTALGLPLPWADRGEKLDH
jgi:flavin-dependent thymidylate synthase